MLRVYFDTNNTDNLGRYALNLETSLSDLSKSEIPPHDGMKVVLQMTNEVECIATLVFDKIWWGVADEDSYQLYDETIGKFVAYDAYWKSRGR
jgi:hypothetical protein